MFYAGFSLVFAVKNIIFQKKYRPSESNNIIFILPTDRPYFFFAALPVDQKISCFRLTLEQRFVESCFDVIVLTLHWRNAESV